MAFTISPQLTLWFIGMVALLSLIIVLMSRLVNPLYARIRKITDRMVTITRQQLQGMRVIRAFGQVAHEEAEFNEVNEDYTKWQLVVSKWSSLISPLTFLVVNGTFALYSLAGAGLYSNGDPQSRNVGRFGQLPASNFDRIAEVSHVGDLAQPKLYCCWSDSPGL